MRGDTQVLKALRALLKFELTTINQAFLHARMCLDWGYEGIAGEIRKHSIASMRYAEQLIDRILFLEGMPNLRDTYPMRIGTDAGKIHSNDLQLAAETARCANGGIEVCVRRDDDTSRDLIEAILDEEEERITWLEAQLKIIEDAGLGLYLSQQIRKR